MCVENRSRVPTARRAAKAVLAAVFAAMAAHGQALDGTAVARPVFGGGLETPCATFLPLLFEGPSWTSHGSSGGMRPDKDGWREFTMPPDGRDSSPRIKGRVRFAAAPDGAVRAEWLATPQADAPLRELCVSASVPFAKLRGGVAVADGREIAIPAQCPDRPQIFRGAVSSLSFRDAAGSDFLSIGFDSPTRVLLQDGRRWGGDSLTVRLFLHEGPVKKGAEYAVRCVISCPDAAPLSLAPGDTVKIMPGADWIPLANEPWIEPGSALDLSRAVPHHAPAGKYGRVVAKGGHFEFERLPGVPQRFYGVNICGDANAPSTPEAADRFAANLSRLGYNALRIHHHENTLVGNSGGPDGTKASAAAMARFDSLVAACVRHGIYLTTDLFVSRSHKIPWRSVGIDRDGCINDLGDFKILCAFHEPAFANLCEWSRNFLTHVNPQTGRSLAEEPALCSLALVNEGNLGNYGAEPLRRLPGVKEAWEKWLDEKGMRDIPRTIPSNLYAPSPAKTSAERHSAAFAMFLADSETRLAHRLTAFLRDELGCKAPVSSLSSWYNPVQYQLCRMEFDYVDDHFYVDHPSFLDRKWKLPSRCPNANSIAGASAGARSVVFRRLADKPFCLTEWNYSGPGRYRGVGGIATGALGALQGWSGMWRFAWSHGRAGVESPEKKTMGYFDLSGDPLSLAADRAAICLFLRGDLAPLESECFAVLREEDLRDPANGAPRCENESWLASAWRAKLGTRVAKASDAASGPSLSAKVDEIAARLDAAGARDGAVSIDREAGRLGIATDRTAGGFAESGSLTAGPVSFALSSAPATVWASSLDGKPIASSSRILVTHLTDVQNSGTEYADRDLKILLDWGRLPHLMRRGEARIALALGDGPAPAVYALSPSGRRIAGIPAVCENGVLRFTADTARDANSATFLYEIVRP